MDHIDGDSAAARDLLMSIRRCWQTVREQLGELERAQKIIRDAGSQCGVWEYGEFAEGRTRALCQTMSDLADRIQTLPEYIQLLEKP